MISIETNKFIVASDKPNNRKFTSLQLGKLSVKDFIISVLSIKFMLVLEQPEYSVKILFSMPTWYPDKNELEINIIDKKNNQLVFFCAANPKKQIKIEIM